MLRVLIVEDEMLVRHGISSFIDWGTLGMSVIADAGNGQAAWEIYEKERPDIILTDIKMPVMDGIKLIERIREQDTRTRIVILSCVDEFEYARKALMLGVTGYILKLTMSQQEMVSVLEKAKSELTQADRLNVADSSYFISAQSDSAIMEYLTSGSCSAIEFERIVGSLNRKLEPDRLFVAVLEIDHFHLLRQKYNESQIQPLCYSIVKATNDLLDRYQFGFACHESDNRLALVLSLPCQLGDTEGNEKLQQALDHLRRIFKTYYDCSITLGVSKVTSGYSSLPTAYQQAMEAISYKYFAGSGMQLYISDIDHEGIARQTASKLEALPTSIELSFVKPAFESLIGASLMTISNGVSKSNITELFLELGIKIMAASGLNTETQPVIICKYESQIETCETIDETIGVLKDYVAEIAEARKKKYYRKQIVLAVRYIQEHFCEDISLSILADIVNLHPNYLSGLFKSEYGVSFIEYLINFRIEKAKDLLMNTVLKSYEIAEKVGFSDESYFCRTFKKITGETPNEFRNHANAESK